MKNIHSYYLKKETMIIIVLGSILFLIAGLKPISISKDAAGYVDLIYKMQQGTDVFLEPTFKFIAYICQYN